MEGNPQQNYIGLMTELEKVNGRLQQNPQDTALLEYYHYLISIIPQVYAQQQAIAQQNLRL